jgi:predicted  nucleic acid-binding Zn-ribbon protein
MCLQIKIMVQSVESGSVSSDKSLDQKIRTILEEIKESKTKEDKELKDIDQETHKLVEEADKFESELKSVIKEEEDVEDYAKIDDKRIQQLRSILTDTSSNVGVEAKKEIANELESEIKLLEDASKNLVNVKDKLEEMAKLIDMAERDISVIVRELKMEEKHIS